LTHSGGHQRSPPDDADLRAIVLEQAAGEMAPDQALAVVREMVRDRRVLTLEGGRMTTLAVRAQEQAIERRATQLAQPAGRDVGDIARENATREVAERIGGPLSPSSTTRSKSSRVPSAPRSSSARPEAARES
jgi:hypothetical protein